MPSGARIRKVKTFKEALPARDAKSDDWLSVFRAERAGRVGTPASSTTASRSDMAGGDITTAGLLWALVEPGARLHPAEGLFFYACAFWFYAAAGGLGDGDGGVWGQEIFRLFWLNCKAQIAIFTVMVQLPTLLTGKMSYVDIGWPVGVVAVALTALTGQGWAARKMLVCGALSLHGLRMALGALALFFPYTFEHGDLSRYQYAKARWIEHTGAPRLWWLKQQHDTAMQAFFNSVGLAGPIILAVTNKRDSLHPVEAAGLGLWLVCWIMENLADMQKLSFVKLAKKNGDLRTAVLGHPPYNTHKFWLWTKCRHPNYFFEWMCWNAFVLIAAPSVLDLWADPAMGVIARVGICVLLYFTSRTFYDCLLWWTGSAPAEARSVLRRPAYRQYQATTNVFFPVSVPGVDPHRTPGWPDASLDLGGGFGVRSAEQ